MSKKQNQQPPLQTAKYQCPELPENIVETRQPMAMSLRWVLVCFCLIWAVALFWLVLSGQCGQYLRPEFAYLLSAAGVIFIGGLLVILTHRDGRMLDYRSLLKILVLLLLLSKIAKDL